MLQAVTDKHSLVRRRLCDLHSMVVGNCICHLIVRTSSNRSIASSACILSFVVGKCFWHFARPAILREPAIRPEWRFLPIPHLHSTPPSGGFTSEYRHPVWCGKSRMVWLPDGEKKFEDMFIRFDMIHERDRQTDRQTDGQTPHDGYSRAFA